MEYVVSGVVTLQASEAPDANVDIDLPRDSSKVYQPTQLNLCIEPTTNNQMGKILVGGSIAINQRTNIREDTIFSDDIIIRTGIVFGAGFDNANGDAYFKYQHDLFEMNMLEPVGCYFEGDDMRLLFSYRERFPASSGDVSVAYQLRYDVKKMTNAVREEMLRRRYAPTS